MPIGALLFGLVIGAMFGAMNLIMTWLDPLADDTPAALLRFYGPMFLLWALASFRASRRSGRLLPGVITGAMVALGTFIAFDVFIFLRINLFLNELTARGDWQNVMMRFRASEFENLRLFVNVDYAGGAPLKLAVSCGIGAVMGAVGGCLGHLTRPRIVAASRAIQVLALTALLSSCVDPSARNEPLPAAQLLTIELTTADALSWPYSQHISADLDGDGDAERVVLASDVQLSEKRRPLWEDGHRWALVIDDGGEKTLAYAAFVPRGFVEAAILQPASSRQREILLQERTPEQLRSIAIGYGGRGVAKAVSAAYYQVESWLPGSAALNQ